MAGAGKNVVENLRLLRRVTETSQERLAEILGKSKPTYYKRVRGDEHHAPGEGFTVAELQGVGERFGFNWTLLTLPPEQFLVALSELGLTAATSCYTDTLVDLRLWDDELLAV